MPDPVVPTIEVAWGAAACWGCAWNCDDHIFDCALVKLPKSLDAGFAAGAAGAEEKSDMMSDLTSFDAACVGGGLALGVGPWKSREKRSSAADGAFWTAGA